MAVKEIFTVTLILFAIIDVIGSIPAILNIKAKTGSVNAKYTTVASGIIMLSFLFLGNSILKLIGVDVYSFAVAGSFILFLISLEMILGRDIFKMHNVSPKSSSVVPIAFPIIVGAGTLTTLISLRAQYDINSILVAIGLNLIIIFVVLYYIEALERLLGATGAIILRKMFGLVLMSIAVKLFTSNAFKLFKLDI